MGDTTLPLLRAEALMARADLTKRHQDVPLVAFSSSRDTLGCSSSYDLNFAADNVRVCWAELAIRSWEGCKARQHMLPQSHSRQCLRKATADNCWQARLTTYQKALKPSQCISNPHSCAGSFPKKAPRQSLARVSSQRCSSFVRRNAWILLGNSSGDNQGVVCSVYV